MFLDSRVKWVLYVRIAPHEVSGFSRTALLFFF